MSTSTRTLSQPATWRVVLAFAAVYIIWGSTYLGIRIAIETMPPFLMAAARFLISGVLLYALTTAQGAPRPTRTNWKAAAIVGALLLLGGNGLVTFSEQRLASGLAAVLVAMTPLWMVILNWLRPGGIRPSLPIAFGLLVGLAGIVVLVSSGESAAGENVPVDLIGVGTIMLATFCWANGSLYSRTAPLPASSLQSTSMEMLVGGGLLFVAGTVTGEWSRLDLSSISLNSWLAFAYLVVFGSIIAYSAYVWLLGVVPPARAATYAYVNPVVAVFLGWALANEPLTGRTLLAAAVIIGAVVIINTYRDKHQPSTPVQTVTPESLPVVGEQASTL
ncbi:MAG: drug/metabolite exporter YedA [Anaerolineae bacterium]|nr:drug/metabolite exporter YedA [Anaerolineae bacterium]